MALITQAPKGTQDLLPMQTGQWQYVERTLLDMAGKYGYGEVRTPVFEHTELFTRSVGDTTDVVQKEMYTFNDKKGRSITLKPEGTAGAVRAAIEHGLVSGQLPVKLSYVTPCFRYEKPQAGRYREFHQFGVELLGASSPNADAEVISLAYEALQKLGVKALRLQINSIGCPQCRPAYHRALTEYFSAHLDKLCPTCHERLRTNPLRLLDCKDPSCKEVAQQAPRMLDYLCDDCQSHFDRLQARLGALGMDYSIDPTIVRGLDYYTKTVFEFVTDAIGAQGTVCGGGRYDGLVGQMGGPATAGIGFGLGLERLMLVMQACGAPLPAPAGCEVYLAPLGEAAGLRALALATALRREGFAAEFDLADRSVKAQLRYADKIGAAFTVVLGEDELAAGQAQLKWMHTGQTQPIPLEEAAFIQTIYQASLAQAQQQAAQAAENSL